MKSVAGSLQRPLRIFVVKASSAFTNLNLNIEALASYGRLDVVARAVIAAFSMRQGLRRDTLFYAALEGASKPIVLELRGWEMLPRPILSETEVGAILRSLMQGREVPGARMYEACFREVVVSLVSLLGASSVFYLHEQGVDISSVMLKEPVAFILGDHKGIEHATEQWLRSIGIRWISLGRIPYFTEHCVTFVHAVLDGLLLE